MKYLVNIDGDSVWHYFCNHCPDSSDTTEVEKQIDEYLSKVVPISRDVCEEITLTICNRLEAVHKSVTT